VTTIALLENENALKAFSDESNIYPNQCQYPVFQINYINEFSKTTTMLLYSLPLKKLVYIFQRIKFEWPTIYQTLHQTSLYKMHNNFWHIGQ
jgi:hypothetical protein